ncbi:uncharacterized protein DUF2382 [Pseudonocardia sediminis]|uniref:Uncharacterized protein DUF2382 n=1 Tax=Pseudonocardia sediminis TaxID=1397368 RepID=A0A4Q7UZ94_PSEST|nr:YsnF/AvaK domain-containing protein [Pseudonocardia sediminis]RZT87296.1 uncharacterized protein DUF2382 [Pseudonocardia sediminis]
MTATVPIGTPVAGAHGEPLGAVATVYTEAGTGRPVWAGVDGARGTAVVPLDGSTFDGTTLHLPYGADHLRDAPPHAPGTTIAPAEAAELTRHYGVRPAAPPVEPSPDDDGVLVRSEERLWIDRAFVETGRARMVTSVITENVTFTVPVRRQVVHLEYDPFPLDRQPPSTTGPAPDVHEVVRYEERVRLVTEVVPVERVRMVTRVVTTEQTLHDRVSHEEIELDEPGPA